MEIPEYIRFDFLLVVLGIGSFYLFRLAYNDKVPAILFLSVGILLFLIGISFIKYNYDLDMEIKELEYAKKKSEYIEFFENKELLTKKSKEEHQKDIKEMINKNK